MATRIRTSFAQCNIECERLQDGSGPAEPLKIRVPLPELVLAETALIKVTTEEVFEHFRRTAMKEWVQSGEPARGRALSNVEVVIRIPLFQ